MRRLPAIITLFVAVVAACVAIVIFQPELLRSIGGGGELSAFKGLMTICASSTSVATGDASLDELVSTAGMSGMLNTIWLIICAMCFGGVMTGSGMLSAITALFMRFVHRTTSIVASTLATGLFCNLTTADQYISIIVTGQTFGQLYRKRGLEGRLLSRSVEDSATVTSVLIPWNSCGMTQSTVLGVSTLAYMPYCLFNIISPLMSLLMAALGYKIYRKCQPEN
jgi:NhaC family Na+:H+ antiporter